MVESPKDTKERILQAATCLFAKKGFAGTSVRDISALAKVNVAGINYHFRSKNELFSEVLKEAYCHLGENLEALYLQEELGFPEFSVEMFHFLVENRDRFFNIFKLYLLEEDHELKSTGGEDEIIGPPGGKALLLSLERSLGKSKVDKDSKFWAVRSLAANIFHMVLVCSLGNRSVPAKAMQDKRLVVKGIKRLAQAILNDLKNK